MRESKTVILPETNKRDLEKVPDEIKDKLKFVFVETVKEVIEEALVKDVDKKG